MNSASDIFKANVHPKGSLSTRVESHIPGTQAHRERKYLEDEDRATFGRHHPVPPVNAGAPGTGVAAQNLNTTGFGPTNTFAPPTQPPPRHAAVPQVGQTYGGAPGVGAGTGFGSGAPGVGMNAAGAGAMGTGGPTFHKHGNTMKERAAELQGRGHTGAGVGTTGPVKTGPHIGDKITGE